MKKIIVLILIMLATLSMSCFLTACNRDESYTIDENSDYGIYWYGDALDDTIRTSTTMDTKYFDPTKPTVVYSHGWKTSRKNDPAETLETHPTTAKQLVIEPVDYLPMFKEQGYNVAIFDWYEYALGSLNSLNGLIWRNSGDGKSLAYYFASELAILCAGDYDKDITLLGHSYGSQMSVATAYLYDIMQSKGEINTKAKIKKIFVADPYWQSGEKLNYTIYYAKEKTNNRSAVEIVGDCFEYLANKDVAIGVYLGMDMASYAYASTLKDNLGSVNAKLSNNSVYVNLRGLRSRYNAMSNIHTIARDYMLISFYTDVFLEDGVTKGPTAKLSAEELKTLKGKFFTQESNSLNLGEDYFKQRDVDSITDLLEIV